MIKKKVKSILVFERTVLTVLVFSVIILDLTPHVFLMQSFDLQRSSILICTLILTFFTKCMIFDYTKEPEDAARCELECNPDPTGSSYPQHQVLPHATDTYKQNTAPSRPITALEFQFSSKEWKIKIASPVDTKTFRCVRMLDQDFLTLKYLFLFIF